MTLAQINEQNLAGVMPALRAKALAFINACRAAGIDVQITAGLRTHKKQDELYAQGRTIKFDRNGRPLARVTNARGGQSMHNFGIAFDFVPLGALGKANWNAKDPAWAKCGKIGQQLGLEWGGAWKGFVDLPHFQMVGGLTLKQLQALYAKGGLNACWQEVAKHV